MKNEKTYHSLDILDGQIVHNCWAQVLQIWALGEETVHGNFCRCTDIWNCIGAPVLPFGYVQQPLAGIAIFEEVTNEESQSLLFLGRKLVNVLCVIHEDVIFSVLVQEKNYLEEDV